MMDAKEARRNVLRLNRIMRQIDPLYQRICELKRECPAPTAEEFAAMQAEREPYSYEVFFLGLLGEIEFHLDEAVEALWKGYRRYGYSNFHRNLSRDCRLSDRAAQIVKGRARGWEQ